MEDLTTEAIKITIGGKPTEYLVREKDHGDLVVFDFQRPHLTPQVNPLGNLVHTGHGRDVAMVLVDGEILVEDGRPTRVDMDVICREAEKAAREVWGDAGRQYWAS